ncbi:MAG: hypothetical protein A3K19_25455 [Lentisphaerae bacterium RIFOXYB12_FULL_65_16]|nr:MAG: hypothetical protein A3K18_15300 [Lentisphaerae bacterium RIFOXYA12_64_32]OGV84880.1 MAG: hypothetical protein A3K19_25455 [Lentisphaerae bacterium RIFOXYB12_FULL_65_16]
MSANSHTADDGVDTHVAPHRRLQPTGMTAVRWTRGFWADRFRLCHDTILPRMTCASGCR